MFFRQNIYLFCVLWTLSLYSSVTGSTLEELDDTEIEKLIDQELYVIVLFGHKNESPTKVFESELTLLRENLVDSINAWVVKSLDSSLKNRFLATASSVGPLVVFFRKGIPVVYTGLANEDDLLEFVAATKEVCTRELTDVNFEHLTQAATGATTGDWFVLFYKEDEACPLCKTIGVALETLACRFRGRINVAQIDRSNEGAATGRRFDVAQVPALIFFRSGKLYRYSFEKFDVDSMSSFVAGFYKNVRAESIALPKSPFDDLIQFCADYIREHPWHCGLGAALPLCFLSAFIYLTKEVEHKKRKKKNN